VERARIASWINRESTRIDSLISKKTRLIELLMEKRQALISHAVTKGLKPNVKTKDSGVEWIGQVPEQWTIGRLGHFATVENGTTPSRANDAYWTGGNIAWLGSGEVNQVVVTEPTEYITELALRECSLRLLPKGTIITGIVGQGKTRGLAAILGIEAAINQNLAAICVGPKLHGEFLLQAFAASYKWLREAGRGSNQAALNCELLGEFRVAVPPMDEQHEILAYVADKAARIDAIASKTRRSIALLRERRSALITAAVTGQIDLRQET
jgi:type I restriction enzyme S subunit